MQLDEHLTAEAEEFNKRIEERTNAGFIPDLRRLKKSEYFYKSFWRDPHFVNLYLGTMVRHFLRMLRLYRGEGQRILDCGCGAGYISLELARAGHHVTAIDISDSCISQARKCLAENTVKDGFGSLEYQVSTLEDITGEFDCVLYSGVLHHLDNPGQVLEKTKALLVRDGVVLCHEPCHDAWRPDDAAQVALLRGLLSLTGHWYETDLGDELVSGRKNLAEYIDDVLVEYVTERDKSEPGGQSPNDNSSNGRQILTALRAHFHELEYKMGVSFIYRFLGGLRGPDPLVHKMADLLLRYEEHAVSSGYLRPNQFLFIGRNPSE